MTAKFFNVVVARLRALARRDAVLDDIDEEMRFHVEMEAQANVERGMSPADARRAALRSFGNLGRMKDAAYEVRGGGMLETLWQDLRYGARMLAKSPGFTLVAVVALALGIGANTAIFSVVNAVLLRALPYRNSDRVVMLWERHLQSGVERNVASPKNFLDWREQAGSFEEVTAFYDAQLSMTGEGEPEQVPAQLSTGNLFKMLGAEAALGRTYTPEDATASTGEPVAVISYGLWQRRFGGSPEAVGKKIMLNGTPVNIIGVMPHGFGWFIRENSQTGKPAELWTPFEFGEAQRTTNAGRGRFITVAALLKPGVTREQAGAEMATISARLAQQYPEFNTGCDVNIVPLREQLSGESRTPLLILLGAVAFVLLIACANVANLMLARAAARQREIAIRTALGAGRFRIVRQLLTESLLLSLAGGAAGLLLATWGVDALVAMSPRNLIGAEGVRMSLPVLGFTFAVSLLTGLLFGLAPALEASRAKPGDALKEGARTAAGGPRARRLRAAFVVAEVALALVLLVGAGLLVRSFARLQAVDPGFDPRNLLTLRVQLPGRKYGEEAKRLAFFRQAVERIGALPGVQAAGAVSFLPFGGQLGARTVFTIEGRPAEPDAANRPTTDVRVADENYFRAMGIPVTRGRVFNAQEATEDRRVVVINEAFARQHFPGEDPVGRHITVAMKAEPEPTEIIGVVGDVKYEKLEGEPFPMIYWTHPQLSYNGMTIVVRTAGDPAGLAAAARREVQAVDPDQPVADVRPMEDWLGDSVSRARFGMLLLAVFAGLAFLLAAVGVYGVMSYTVAQRTQELGIRMALGAQPRDVRGLVLRQGMLLAVTGVGLGLAAAFALTRLMSSLLYGVSATDPATFAVNTLLLCLVALVACYVPARRATRIDPMIALRYE